MTVLLAIALKGGIVVLVATLATRLLRRAPASTRHGVWVAAFAALLLLPALEVAGPRWSVGVLPAPDGVRHEIGPPFPPAPPSPEWSGTGLGAPLSERTFEHDMAAFEAEMADFEHEMALFEAGMEHAPPAWATTERPPLAARRLAPVVGWSLLLWAVGVAVVGLGWLAALLSARRIVATARVEDDEEWGVAAERARRLAGLDAPVRLLRSDALDVPIAWGWGGGAVVLPPEADAWDDDRREAVLLHEMAHLARRDAWSQAVAQTALAVHWPNPLAWWGYRRFLDAREQACDDAVLRSGARPSAYAAHLVGVARAVRRDRFALAAVSPMARTAPIEDRVVSILDADRLRERFGARALTGTAVACAAVLLPLAALQPVAQSRPAPISSPDWTAVADTLDDLYHADEARAEDARVDAENARLDAEDARADAKEQARDAWQDAMDAAEDASDALDADDMDEVEAALDAADDEIEEAGRQIRRTIADLERQVGPEAGLRISALRQAETGLAQIDRQAIREQVRAEAGRALRSFGPRPHETGPTWTPKPPAPPVPPAVDWTDVERARRAALRHSLNENR